MKAFMDQDFLLETETARKLFHQVAESQPIIDYHCHLNPKEIWENKPYRSITQVWLGGDHYKWRLMRSAGVEEKYVTGDASERDKFQKWAETLALAIGNPLYHWSHLELRRFFGYEGVLNGKTAEEVWTLCNEKLAQSDFTPRRLIERSGVETICTTDDPIDTLEYHQQLAQDASFKVTVLPAWRPDKALNIDQPTFLPYVAKLGEVSGVAVKDFASFKRALENRLNFFHENGCRLSDHALFYVMYAPATDAQADAILAKALRGEAVTDTEALQYKTACMQFLGREYNRRGWTMQLHYGALRNANGVMFDRLGPDTGYDAINNYAPTAQMGAFLNAFGDELPKTVLYSLNPCDDEAICSLIGCFQNGNGFTKVQQGSAWWFNDHIDGMQKQMRSLASLGYLAGFLGMLTDSRSFLSYPRHEYFRRILCNLVGHWVEDGQFPNDEEALQRIVKGISYENAKKYFGFPQKA